MNAHQRKKLAAAKHYRMPLGCDVLVRIPGTPIYRKAKVWKHDSQRPNVCIVEYPDGAHDWVTLYRVQPTQVNKVRPWWRVTREKHAAKSNPSNKW